MLDTVPLVDPEEAVPAFFLQEALEATRTKNIALARRLGMDAGTVSNWKTGKTPIAPSRWIAIKAALGLPITWVPPSVSTSKAKPQ